MGIEGKVVVITGASSGIGRATAKLLADRGAFVVLGARRPDDLEALIALAVNQGGKLDVLVNNAGIGPISRFDALRVEDWDAMIDVNLRGTLWYCRGIAGVSTSAIRPYR